MHIETTLVRSGVAKDPRTGSVSTPIYQSATFEHPGGVSTGYDYSRTANPTRTAIEEAIAALEKGATGLAFSSGMSAITTVLFLFKPGDHLIVSEDLYGGTYRLLEEVFNHYSIEVSFVDTSDIYEVESAVRPSTKAIFVETPTNPLMKISDLKGVIQIAQDKSLLTIVDNTFMTPYFQQPLLLGADIVIHSATKYLGGHNDVIAGLLVAREQSLGEKLRFLQNSAGTILGPQDSWLLLRGIKTLALRMERHQENAEKLAKWLKEQPEVEEVYFPGLPEHPNYEIGRGQSSGFGGMLSFTVKDKELVSHILGNLKLITFAESLGGVESLITFPAKQTHADIPEEIRNQLGITDRLLRLSVGIEHVEDLIQDFKEAFHGCYCK
ncbi:trans-sulfuration enzyme family protein [Aneurinibacillus tyrosinisolvens]|uniref:trans-sulfuration enzyme family protein n=1 Tax=Aneurinibacillus tyrosinisolvens TaxID=1443435 RepID=UPI00063F4689|nr:PLP-dependent aspartate aminotransferase family protein [Aneurinibacillus tyrosinisolvens]